MLHGAIQSSNFRCPIREVPAIAPQAGFHSLFNRHSPFIFRLSSGQGLLRNPTKVLKLLGLIQAAAGHSPGGRSMSRLFEALRKSEEETGKHSFNSPEAFFDSIDNKQSLLVREEQLFIRPENRIVVYTDPHSPGGEQFRLLRSCLRELQSG